MVDAGTSCKNLQKQLDSMDVDPSTILGLFLSHEHSDHVKGVSVLARRFNIPVYAHPSTWYGIKMSDKHRRLIDFHPIEANTPYKLGPWTIQAFATSHDTDVSLGFKLDGGSGIVSVLTDTGRVDRSIMEHLQGSDLVFVEANYDEGMLWNGPYPWPLKRRIASDRGHLSNLHASTVISQLYEQGTEHFVLTHLSDVNNSPDLAYETVATCLEDQGILVDEDLFLTVAPRYHSSLWFDVSPATVRDTKKYNDFIPERFASGWSS